MIRIGLSLSVLSLPSLRPASGQRPPVTGTGLPGSTSRSGLASWVSYFRLILNGGEPYAEVKPVNDFPLDVAEGVLGARCTGDVLILGRERRHARRYWDNGWTPGIWRQPLLPVWKCYTSGTEVLD